MAEETKVTEQVKSSKQMPSVIIIALVSFLVTVLVTGTILVLTLGKFDSGKKPTSTKQTQQTQSDQKNKDAEPGPMIPLGNEIIVNLPGNDGNDHYLKVNVTIEADTDKTKDEVTKRIPEIRDMIITILSATTKEKIIEKEGKELVRSEIINGINRHLVEGKAKNVYFEDFVVQ